MGDALDDLFGAFDAAVGSTATSSSSTHEDIPHSKKTRLDDEAITAETATTTAHREPSTVSFSTLMNH